VKGRIVALVVVCLLVIAGAAFVGATLSGPRGDFIFWQLRVPRVLVGVMVGGTLALTGAVFQALFAKSGLRLNRVLPTAHPAVDIVEVVAADARQA